MPCRGCGRPGTQHCAACQRKRGTTSERGYGAEHQRARRDWVRRVQAGERPPCRRCLVPIEPGEPIDVGHWDDRTAQSEPEHRSCNRATNRRTP